MPTHEYSFDFASGLGPWMSWMAPSLIRSDPGLYDSFVRLHAPGALDPNHIDGIGALSLVAHLSAPIVGSPGIFDLRDAEIEITIKGHDFDPHGAKLCFWIVTYIPELDLTLNFPFGLQATNWANTGNDIADDVTDQWQTLTLQLSDDPADWTYAGNFMTDQGDWAQRYEFLNLTKSLSAVDATLHLVTISDSPDQRPTGFLDIANITVRTANPAAPNYVVQPHFIDYGVEDEPLLGQLTPPSGATGTLTYALVGGSAQNGSVSIDPSTGAYSFTPNPDYYGPTDSAGPAGFQYTVTSDAGTSEPLTAYLFIAPINDAPSTATLDEGFTIAADQPFAHSLFKGSDIDGDDLTFEVVDGSVEHGTLSLEAATGRYVFTPDAGYSGAASFQYLVSDGQLDSAPKTVAFTVAPPGNPPTLPSFTEVIDTYLLQGDMPGFVRWTIRLADAGNVDASYHYGSWLNGGLNVTRNTALAAQFLEVASAVYEDAVLQLALLYSSGDGVARDYAVARQLYASLPYSADAHYRLAILDELGLGAPMDHVAAGIHFIEAATLGNADAMYMLGRRYLVGDGLPESPADAYFWLGVGLREGGGPDFAVFDDFLESNMALAAADLSPAEIAALDSAIAAWAPSNIVHGNGTIVGSALADTLIGADLSDYLVGLGGDDRLVGGSEAANALQGGPGDDIYVVSLAGDTLTEFAGEGVDTVETALAAYALRAQLENLTYTGSGDFSGTGNELANVITGGAGNDSLHGGLGDDRLIGREGNNTLAGGEGVDSADYSAAAAAVSAELNGSVATANGFGGTDVLLEIEDLTGSAFDDVLIGNAVSNRLAGGEGHDVLVGLDGDDILDGGNSGAFNELQGGPGDDVYIVSLAGDTITELAGEGVDTVETALAAYGLWEQLENLTYTGSGDFSGTGNELANVITGGAGNDSLHGGLGDDRLIGREGNNTLAGGEGVDSADYSAAAAAVRAQLNGSVATANGFGGTDVLLAIEDLIGSAFDDVLIGNAASNRLAGGEGRDVLVGLDGDDILDGGNSGASNQLQGGRGNDTYVVSLASDTLVEFAGEGTDTVETVLANYTLRAHFENLTFTGAGGFAGTGNELANVITGGAGNDSLHGGLGDDLLIGREGNNTLGGGEGVDSADYSAAAAAVRAQLNGSVAIANGFGGTDVLLAIEDLIGSAFDDVLIGNAASNRLAGGEGRDVLVGLDGDDILDGGNSGASNQLQGGRGNDTYVVSLAGDTLVEFAGEGTDTVETVLANYTLRAHFENLTFTGAGGFAGSGNDLANVITGGADNDSLNGGLGNDILIGLGGADLFIFGTAPDPANIDTIIGFAAGSDRIAVDNAVFAGLATGTLSASAFVVGSAAADADDRIIYNPETGAVLFDVDGVGGADAVQFATVDPGLPLVAGDFAVI